MQVSNTSSSSAVYYNANNDQFALQQVNEKGTTKSRELSRDEVNDLLKPFGLKVGDSGSEVVDAMGVKHPWAAFQGASTESLNPKLPATSYTEGAEQQAYQELKSTGAITTMVANGAMFEIFFEMLKSEKLQAHAEGMIAIEAFRANIAMLKRDAELEIEKIGFEKDNAVWKLGVSIVSSIAAAGIGVKLGAAGASAASGMVSSGAEVVNKCMPGMPQYEIDQRTVAMKWTSIIAKEQDEMKKDSEKQADAATSFFKQILEQIKKLSELASGREFKLF